MNSYAVIIEQIFLKYFDFVPENLKEGHSSLA